MKYIQSQPHPQAGLGHQFHNWVLGMVLSNKFNCEFINTNFTCRIRNGVKNINWNDFLNFNKGLKNLNDIKPKKVVDLPKLDLGHNTNLTNKQLETRLSTWSNIIKNNPDNTLFKLPLNQYIGVLSEFIHSECSDYLKECYWSKNVKHDFNNDLTNVVVHIRRGDISKKGNTNRWIEISEYKKQMDCIRKKYKKVKFHVLSEGNIKNFNEIKSDDVNLCINYGDLESFNMMCSSDILVTGLSSFSILTSYLTKGLVFYNPLLNFTKWDNIDNFYNIKNLCLD